MPVIKSAIKKLRQDRKREKENDKKRRLLDIAINSARKSPAKINEAFSVVDRAVKSKLIHKKKAARIKSSLSKLGLTKAPKSEPKKSVVKKTVTKSKKTRKQAKK